MHEVVGLQPYIYAGIYIYIYHGRCTLAFALFRMHRTTVAPFLQLYYIKQ